MKVYHQMGFRDKWNIDCLKSGIGDGLIFSPINMDSDKLLALPKTIREKSFLDPQFYLLNREKSTNITYPFFQGILKQIFRQLIWIFLILNWQKFVWIIKWMQI